jgi:hypothetical protein
VAIDDRVPNERQGHERGYADGHAAGLVHGLEYAVHRLETDLYGCRNSKRLVEMQKALEYAREYGELLEA